MTEAFVILLAPVFLLAIVALFGFIGCSFAPLPGAGPTPVVEIAAANSATLSATLMNLSGGELLVATLQWGGGGTPNFTSGGVFQPVSNGGPFKWNGMDIQVFSAINATQGSSTITVNLSKPSPVQWSLCICPYATKALNPLYGAVNNGATFTGAVIKAPPITLNPGDSIYAVAFAADGGGVVGNFPGKNSLSVPGPFFTPGSSDVTNPLLEIGRVGSDGGAVAAEATNSNTSNPRGFIFAVGVHLQIT
jgi:hypothetical protein